MNTYFSINPKLQYLLFGMIFLFFSQLIVAQAPILPTLNDDNDGDGVTVGQGDCDDFQPLVYPGANEIEDGQDNDCDGLVDAVEGDCDDFTFPGVITGSETLCNGETPRLIQSASSPTGGSGDMQVIP